MGAQTGRTVSKWTRFVVDDSSSTLREIPVSTINGVGLTYDEAEAWALQDALKAVLPNTPDASLEISGPFDNSAAVAASASGVAPALSGSHTVLSGIVGGNTPLSLGIYIGIRQIWVTGEPTWGLSASATSGFLCTDYQVDPAAMTYTAKFRVYPGSSAPAWGTNAIT
jgi:hypothetical protein